MAESVNEEFETFIQIPREFTWANHTLDNSSVINAIGDYSSVSADFSLSITNDNTNIVRINIFISDAGLAAVKYGGIDAVANGVKLYYKKPTSKVYFSGVEIKSNSEWKQLSHDEILSSYGVGNSTLSYRLTFGKVANIVLNSGDEFGVELSDSFVGLDSHCFNVQYYY